MEKFSIEMIEEIKQKYMQKYDISKPFADDRIIFLSYKNEKLLALIEFYNTSSSDNNLYLFDCDKVDNWSASPIAQIKFLDNGDEFYLRRLEFVDDSYRGKGYASVFMQGLEKYCERNHYNTITGELIPLHNEKEEYVQKFYEKNGFTITVDEQGQKHINKKIKKVETDNETLSF